MKYTFILVMSFLLISMSSLSQIVLRIDRVNADSLHVELPRDTALEMNKKYVFLIKTNIDAKEKLYENLTDSRISDGKLIDFTFNYHEFEFEVYKQKGKRIDTILASQILHIKGTKYVVKIDGKTITRLEPNNISPNSKIDIELVSETTDRNRLEVKDPVILFWMGNQSSNVQRKLSEYNLSFDLSNEEVLKKGETSNKFNYLILLLPQVTENGQELLPDEQQERMYIMMYKK